MSDDQAQHDMTVEENDTASIADRLKSSELLNNATLLGVLEELPIGVFIADKEGRIVYGNKAGREISPSRNKQSR